MGCPHRTVGLPFRLPEGYFGVSGNGKYHGKYPKMAIEKLAKDDQMIMKH
jgi:hypothetical protein